jgi:hypothetical protein
VDRPAGARTIDELLATVRGRGFEAWAALGLPLVRARRAA